MMSMSLNKMPYPNDYIVVECQTAPNPNNNHVCVPRSWIKCEIGDSKVAIAYPSEDEFFTATRIKNKEMPDDEWRLYIGNIKYDTKSYMKAINFIKTTAGNNSDYLSKESYKQIEDKNTKNGLISEPKDSKVHAQDNNNKNKINNVQQQSILDSEYSSHSIEPQVTKECPCINKPVCQNNSNLPKSLESKIEEIINSSVSQRYMRNKISNSNNFEPTQKNLSENLNNDLEKGMNIAANLWNANLTPEEMQFLLHLQNKQNETLMNIKVVLLYLKNLYLEVHEGKKTLDQIITKHHQQPPRATVPPETDNEQNTNTLHTEDDSQDVEMGSKNN